MTSQEFKNQIGKYLGSKIREFGFMGSGFNYIMASDHYIFTIGIQANQYGGSFCVEFGIQPKKLKTNGFEELNFSKLKYYNCELRMRMARPGKGAEWWSYSEVEDENLRTIDEVIAYYKNYGHPIIQNFIDNPTILERIEVKDLKNISERIPRKLSGLQPMISATRIAWMMAIILEDKDIKKSLDFARYILSKESDNFFGTNEMKRIVKVNSEKQIENSWITKLKNKLK